MEKVVGYLGGGVLAWERAGLELRQTPQVSVLDLNQQLCAHPCEWQVLDVRNPGEWRAGHIANVSHLPLDRLSLLAPQPAAEEAWSALHSQAPVAVHCKSGYRSSIAASLLERAGFTQVMNVVGGFDAWQAQKLPVISVAAACGVSAEAAADTAKSA
jgi:hydroxyacylglutathione hydrolase